jgi:hypothetical protein
MQDFAERRRKARARCWGTYRTPATDQNCLPLIIKLDMNCKSIRKPRFLDQSVFRNRRRVAVPWATDLMYNSRASGVIAWRAAKDPINLDFIHANLKLFQTLRLHINKTV